MLTLSRSRRHFIDAAIDAKRGNRIRVVTEGDDLEEVLKIFCERARFVAAHTEAQLQKIHKKNPQLISDVEEDV